MQRLKTLYAEKHTEFWELIRYVVAGALTTVVSLIVSYGLYFLLALNSAPEMPTGGVSVVAAWVADVINLATTQQVAVSNMVSWIVAVLFAFWINRWMVFCVQYADQKSRFTAFFQFVSARIVTLLLFELGLAALLSILGIQNIFGRIIVLILVIVFNYIASKYWVFKQNKKAENG